MNRLMLWPGGNRCSRTLVLISSLASENFFQILPPSLWIRAACTPVDKRLLHAVCHLPPLPHFWIRSHFLHISFKVAAIVLHGCKSSIAVKVDRIIADVAILDLLEYRRPCSGVAVLVSLYRLLLKPYDLSDTPWFVISHRCEM
jgi:hypothetical protein